ncbi:MAG: 3-methyl-2-oxobutanoate dehydrogenase subunit VorB [Firmicutes bacterium]|nr:3-methyl-2-oxobutanoate dehydrogenase subunit VorB [Bacillota bacterium]MBQ3123586.1 3-methyl-2-oxobutanoate dehydrogenase subunit VorB [Bacillota bacterium]MBQ9972614.1 3-methyl-2-oxobutanoate dehydrogenase subunit VorB [Bacillota bacterium]
MKGNEALAEAALRAGSRFYSGYPITPQTEILEYLSWRMPEVGGFFVQAESELCGINMVFGAAAAGARAFTTSSGPGYSLKQEGISYLAGSDLPAVIIDVMRIGSALGDIFMGQGDYWQLTKGGGHGDYRNIVLAPNSVQENVDHVFLAFDLAEKYLHPVIIASDAGIGQMMEPVELPDFIDYDKTKHDAWRVKGNPTLKAEDMANVTNVYYKMSNPAFAEKIGYSDYPTYLKDKYAAIEENEQRWESYMVEDAEAVIVAYGSSSRIAKETVNIAREQGFKLGMIRPITLWPFPKKAFEECKAVKAYATVEVNILGQMKDDVEAAIKYAVPVGFVGDFFKVPDPDVIIEYVKGLL